MKEEGRTEPAWVCGAAISLSGRRLLAFPSFALDLAKELRLFLFQSVEEVEPGLEGRGIDIETFAQVTILLVKGAAVLAHVWRDQFVAQFLVMRHSA